MALNATEQQIASYGAANGKSQAEVQQAILKYRASGSPAVAAKPALPVAKTTLKSVASDAVGQVKDAAKSGLSQTASGYKEAAGAGDEIAKGGVGAIPIALLHAFEGSADLGAGVINTVLSPLAPVVNPTLGKAINYAGDKLADTPLLKAYGKDTASLPADQLTAPERIAKGIQNVTTLAAAPEIIEGGISNLKKIKNIPENIKANIKPTPKADTSVLPLPKKAASSVRDSITHLPADVSQVLKTGENPAAIKTELETALTEGKKSITSGGRELSPYEIVGRDHISKGMGKLDEVLKTSGEAISEHAEKFKDTPVTDIVTESLGKLQSLAQSRLGTVFNGLKGAADATGKTFEENIKALNDSLSGNTNISLDNGLFSDAEGRKSLVTKNSDKALLAKTFASLQDLAENGATAQHLSDTIKNINEDLDFQQSSKPSISNTKTEGVVKQVLGGLNDELTKLGQDANGNNPFADAKATFSTAKRFKDDIEKRLGGKVVGSNGYKNSASLLIRRLSPQDSGTRAVLRQFEDITGVPVFQHAIIAKFAMDILKDSRVKSVLESISDGRASKQGIVQSIWHTIVNAVKDPQGKAMRILDDRIGKEGTKAIYDAVKANHSQLTGGALKAVTKQK